jgi:PQQ-dependent catabolism-associated CXXCW motif protein
LISGSFTTKNRQRWVLPPLGAAAAAIGRGSLSSELEGYFRSHLEAATNGSRDVPVVFYCLADCWMSWNAAKRAASWGYKRIYWYPDGIDGWEAAKLLTADAVPVP